MDPHIQSINVGECGKVQLLLAQIISPLLIGLKLPAISPVPINVGRCEQLNVDTIVILPVIYNRNLVSRLRRGSLPVLACYNSEKKEIKSPRLSKIIE